jgi:ribosomal protein S18 acetylase RimI-like enzyme
VRRALEDGFELDDDPARVDIDVVHRYLSDESYWAKGRDRETVARYVATADRVVALYDRGRLVGFCRAVATPGLGFVYLADVFVLPEARRRGLGVELVREMVEHGPYAAEKWLLHTADAQGLYEKVGFGAPGPRLMERPAPT